MSYKPEGYNSLSPYLIVKDAERLISMLETAFDGEVTRMYDRPDGSVMHAEVRLDDSIIMISEATEEFPPNQSMLHFYVPDVDASYQRALDAGFEGLQEPVQKGDPDKRGSLKDHNGNWWSVSTQLEE